MRRFKCFLSLSLLVASSNAFAGGGGGGGGGGLTDEEMSALCGYAGYAIIALLALVVVYGLGIWRLRPAVRGTAGRGPGGTR